MDKAPPKPAPIHATERHGKWVALGSITAAIASSACCWLPLVLIVFGVSATGISAWFLHYRALFLLLSMILLALGFFLVYRPRSNCCHGPACSVAPNRNLSRRKTLLLISTLVVIASAAFPRYIGTLISPPGQTITSTKSSHRITLKVNGLDCEACAIPLAKKLDSQPEVAGYRFDYGASTLELSFQDPFNNPLPAIRQLVENMGFEIEN